MRFKINDFRGGVNSKIDASVLGLNKGKMAFNFDYSSGALCATLPFKPFVFNGKTTADMKTLLSAAITTPRCQKVFFFKKNNSETGASEDKLVVYNYFNKLAYTDLYSSGGAYGKFVSLDAAIVGEPSVINYNLYGEDVMIISGSESGTYLWNGNDAPVEITKAPKITSMCVHNERLFVTTGDEHDRVWFSDELDPTNFDVSLTGAGYIDMPDERGKPLRVISFNGYVYIFRENGISRLYASGAQEDFYLSHLFVSGGKIFPKTIAVAGDRIMFLATDGIYEFDGANVKRVLTEVFNSVSPTKLASGEYAGGKYYLAVNINYDDSYYPSGQEYNNSLICIDPLDGSYTIFRGLFAYSICSTFDTNGEGKLMIASDSEDAVFFVSDASATPLAMSVYYSPVYDFGVPSKKKTVRRVRAYLDGPSGHCSICLVNEKDNQVMEYWLNRGVNDIPTLFSGAKVGYLVRSMVGCKISDIMLDVFA